MPFQQREEIPVRLVRRLQFSPQSRGVADAHEPAGVEAERAQGTRAIDHPLGLMDIEPSRGESDLQRQTRCPRGAACSMRLGQRCTRALALVDVLRVAVEAYLYRPNRQARESFGDRGIEALAIGFDLELHAALA